jgi:rubrerythrin
MSQEQHDSQHSEVQQRLVKAYDEMMAHAKSAIEHAREETLPPLQHVLEAARDKAVEMGEVTLEEAEKVSGYLYRDLEHAARYMREERQELSDWLRFDIKLVEQRLAGVLTTMVDHTREVLDEFAVQADAMGWKTGEIVGPGTLRCRACRQELHFHETGHVPPCPKCKRTHFSRVHDD